MGGWGSKDPGSGQPGWPCRQRVGWGGARFPSRLPHKAWELPPDFAFESQGERGREGLGLTFSVPRHLASPGRGKQTGTPMRSQPRGLQVLLQWERCRGALGRGHPFGKETPRSSLGTGEPGRPSTLRSLPEERP